MLTFLSNNWLWIVLFLGGMVLMHRAHGGHGGGLGGHGSAVGGHGAACGGDHSGEHQDSEYPQHTEPVDTAGDGAGRTLAHPPVS